MKKPSSSSRSSRRRTWRARPSHRIAFPLHARRGPCPWPIWHLGPVLFLNSDRSDMPRIILIDDVIMPCIVGYRRGHAKSRFFWTRNSSGAVLAVGETRPAADFYVSADLTRTSERRLQAGIFWVLSSSDRDFPKNS